jgi:hypothetical protein
MSEKSSAEYISLPVDRGRIETTTVNNGDQIDLHVANADLLDLTAARALVRQREATVAFEREQRPSTPRDFIDIAGENIWRIKAVHGREATGETVNVVSLRQPRTPASQQNFSQAA